MENNTPHTEMKDTILASIDAGKISMRPKFLFTLKLLAIAVTAIAILLLSIGIVNFILFSIRLNSHDVLLGFGMRGFETFILLFPWPLVVFDIGALALLQHLLRQFRFGYKTPVMYMFLALIAASVFAGVVVDRGTPINDELFIGAREQRLPPPLGALYGGIRHEWDERDGLCRCTIVQIVGNSLIVSDARSASTTFTVILPANDGRATTSGLSVGDTVMVAGDLDDSGVIRAFGVRFARPIPSAPPQTQ